MLVPRDVSFSINFYERNIFLNSESFRLSFIETKSFWVSNIVKERREKFFIIAQHIDIMFLKVKYSILDSYEIFNGKKDKYKNAYLNNDTHIVA